MSWDYRQGRNEGMAKPKFVPTMRSRPRKMLTDWRVVLMYMFTYGFRLKQNKNVGALWLQCSSKEGTNSERTVSHQAAQTAFIAGYFSTEMENDMMLVQSLSQSGKDKALSLLREGGTAENEFYNDSIDCPDTGDDALRIDLTAKYLRSVPVAEVKEQASVIREELPCFVGDATYSVARKGSGYVITVDCPDAASTETLHRFLKEGAAFVEKGTDAKPAKNLKRSCAYCGTEVVLKRSSSRGKTKCKSKECKRKYDNERAAERRKLIELGRKSLESVSS